MVSRCCKNDVTVEFDYYVCDKCGRPSDTIIKDMEHKHGCYDVTKVEEIINYA